MAHSCLRLAKPPPPRAFAAYLKTVCDQFLQSLTGGGTSKANAAVPQPADAPRLWLDTSVAAAYTCYEGVLKVVKELLTPHYRAQVVDRDGFKRIVEETTLLLVQQLLAHSLEDQPDFPAHYHSIAADMVFVEGS